MDTLAALRYVDHVVVNVSEVLGANGKDFMGYGTLDVRKILRVPPCFKLRYARDRYRVNMKKEIEKDAIRFGKAMRLCRFLRESLEKQDRLCAILKVLPASAHTT